MHLRLAVAVLALLGALLLPYSAGQQMEPGPPVTVLVHHPYPDDADPLGFPYPADAATGYFAKRYRHLDADRNGFDFPSMVADGVVLVEGLVDPSRPYASTRDGYEAAFEARREVEPAVTMQLGSRESGGRIQVDVAVLPNAALPGESLRLWLALTEDPVRYVPPAALSNGVFDHRFTVRAIQDLGPVDLSAGTHVMASHSFALASGWDPQRLIAAAWLQQDGVHGTRFDAHEVVQATSNKVSDGTVTQQTEKGVLMELWSATWCDPCLYGDTAMEALAVEHGAAEPIEKARSGTHYFQPPAAPLVVAGAALAAAWLAGDGLRLTRPRRRRRERRPL